MKIATPFRFSLKLVCLGLLSAVAWSTALGQSTTKPALSATELCLPASLTVTFDYTGGTANTSTTVIVQLRDNSGTPNTTVLNENVIFTTDGSGNATGVQATLNLTTATAGIVGNNRRVRIRNAANTSTLSTANSDELKIKATPTLSGTSQASAVCSGTNATINLTGLLPNITHSVRYKIGSGSNVNVPGVLSDGSGNASFTVPVTSADNGQTLTINRLRSPAGFDCDLQPSGGNTVTLQVNPLPTATLSFAEGDEGTVCSTDPLPSIAYNLTGAVPWTISINNNPVYVTESGVSVFQTSAAGPYQITSISDANGCVGVASNTLDVVVNPAATASGVTLGASEICQGGTTVSADFGGGATSGSFSDGGAGGSFSNVATNGSTVSATYTPGPNFTGQVTITFTTNDPDGPCPATTSTTSLTVNPAATATTPTLGAAAVCRGSSTTVSATFGGSATGGSFSDGDAGGSFTNVSTSGSSVSATYTPASGFSGTATLTFTTNDPDGPCPAATATVGLTVNALPSLNSVSASPSPVCAGSPLTLSASASGGTAPLTYAWSGPGDYQATGASVQRTAATGTEGLYSVTVTDANACQASGQTESVSLKVPVAVQGITPNQTAYVGETVSLTVSGTGLGYQWYKTSVSPETKLTGQTSATLSLSNLQLTDAGTYVAEINDDCGNALTASTSLTVNLPTVGVPTLAGTPACAGQTVTLTFAATGPAGSHTAQLSDKDGSFAAPVSLGAVTPGSNPVVLPLNLPSGSGYRMRVVRSSPAVTSEPTVAFGITALTVALYPATPSRICLGEELPVTFSTLGNCPFPPGNGFTVQLSSATGSFANPTVLGAAQPGTTSFPLPQNLPVGTGYRVRIVSTNPAQASFASAPFKLEGPSLSLTPGVGGAPVCRGQAVTLSVSLPAGSCPFPEGNVLTAQLSSASGSFTNPVNLGAVQAGIPNSVTIPASSAAGTGYRIRVVSSSPALTSLSSSPFRVNGCVSRLSAEVAELIVSPNPAVGREIRLRVSGMDNPQFGLTTSAGRSVGISVKTDGSGEWVLTPKQALVPGVYAVGATEGSTRITRRVLVTD